MSQLQILPPDQVQLPAYAMAPATAAQIALRGTLDETGGVSVRRITPDNGRFNFFVGDTPVADPGPMNVVVVAFVPRMGRNFWEGAFSKGEAARRPDCWSADGITPDDDVPALTKQSAACGICPKSMKGSKVVDGLEMTACSLHQKVVVCPPSTVGDPNSIYLMNINATSVLSRNVPAPYMSYRDYLSWFRQRNASGANVLPQHALTEISFAVRADAPNHMQFRIANWAPEARARQIEEFATHPMVQMYLHGPNGPKRSGVPLLPAAAVAPAPVAAPVYAAPAAATIYAAPVPNAFAQPAQMPAAATNEVSAPAGFGAFTQPVAVAAQVVAPAATNAPPPGRRGRGRAADPAVVAQAPAQTASAFGSFGAAPAAAPVAPAQGGFGAPAPVASAFSAAAGFGGFADQA